RRDRGLASLASWFDGRLAWNFASQSAREVACASPLDEERLNRASRHRCPVRLDLFHQTLDAYPAKSGEILFNGRQRRTEKAGFGNIVKAHKRNLLRNLDRVFFKSSDCSQGHLIVGNDDCGEFPPMMRGQLSGCFKAGFSSPIPVNNRSQRKTRCLQFLFPTDITNFSCPPWNRPAEMGDFPMAEPKQMTRRLARARLLVDKDRGTFEPEIRIDGYQWYISTDVVELAQIEFP